MPCRHTQTSIWRGCESRFPGAPVCTCWGKVLGFDLEDGDLRLTALRILDEAMASCSIEQAFAAKLVQDEHEPRLFRLRGGQEVDLSHTARLLVIAVGKAAAGMLAALLRHLALSQRCEVEGILIAPSCPADLPRNFTFFGGRHPLPDEQSFAGARAAQALLHEASLDPRAANTFCFFLISGGASAMMELPLDPRISLQDTIAFHKALVHSGASIAEINCVRKHFSAVKGGRLAQALGGLPFLTLAVSDVPEGRLDALGSGPTVPDSSTVEDCRDILNRYVLMPQFPIAVQRYFASSFLMETPKPGSFHSPFFVLLSSADLAQAAAQSAMRLGFSTVVDNGCDDWEAKRAAVYLLERLRELGAAHRTACVVSVGEVTVRLPEDEATPRYGHGGRNSHFALQAAMQLHEGEPVVILSAGSDGVDGNSPAAGAVIDAVTVHGRETAAEQALAHFDSYTFLQSVGSAIVTGPSGNNVRDLRLLLARRR